MDVSRSFSLKTGANRERRKEEEKIGVNHRETG